MGSITHVVAALGKEAAVAGQDNQSVESGEVPENNILNRYEYDAWGNLTVCEETVRFNGQQYDPVSQQYYLRARYYNPVIGRFTQEDTYRGDGLNLYTYCRNNPVCYVDPSGHMTCEQAQEQMRRAIAANQDIRGIDPSTASQLRKWYQFKNEHNLLTSDERYLATQIGLDVDGTEGGTGVRTYQTYTKTNPKTGQVYSGRTSGTGTPAENVRRRDANHHMNDKGFGPAVLDRSSSNSQAIRGREQMLIDHHGGAQSTGGNSGNAINGISSNNKNRDNYINAARGEFGDIE